MDGAAAPEEPKIDRSHHRDRSPAATQRWTDGRVVFPDSAPSPGRAQPGERSAASRAGSARRRGGAEDLEGAPEAWGAAVAVGATQGRYLLVVESGDRVFTARDAAMEAVE